VAEAKAVCAGCPVRPECLAFALQRDLHGIWGATTEDERRLMRRADRRVAS
jgi:WhiB family redox-sensing transcriptional regulator